MAALKPRHRRQELLAFLKQVARTLPGPAGPDQQLHLVLDNYAAHRTGEVKEWLADNLRIVVHFTATHASWKNLVEVWSASSAPDHPPRRVQVSQGAQREDPRCSSTA